MFRAALCIGAIFVAVALHSTTATPFYVPGIEPVSYNEGDTVAPLVNGLHSTHGVLAYPYYAAPFCRPQELHSMQQTLGEVLMGDRFQTGGYSFDMKQNVQCKLVHCTAAETIMTPAKLKALEKFIDLRYHGWMVLDNLPVFNNGTGVYRGCHRGKANTLDSRGYALGVAQECTGKATLINNHLQFRIQYHTTGAGEHRVVGFTVVPFSIDHQFDAAGKVTTCGETFNVHQMAQTPVTTNPAVTKRIAWSYSVEWVEEPTITWASRWNSYFRKLAVDSNDKTERWVALLLSLALAFTISLVLRRDILLRRATLESVEAEAEQDEEEEEETECLQVFASDVLRPPAALNSLVVGVATGAQLLGMVLVTLFLACLGFLSPANRGGLVTVMLFSFAVLAFAAGYVAARMLICFSQKSWLPILFTGLALPGLMLSTYILGVNSGAAAKSIRAPPAALFTMVELWLAGSLPLLALGAKRGFAVSPPERGEGLRISDKVRQVPPVPWDQHGVTVTLLAGLIPLASIFVELHFVLRSMWQGMVNYGLGFSSLAFVLWSAYCALVSVAATHHRLCGGNYHWWWVAFLAPSGAAVPPALYVMYDYATQMTATTTAATIVYGSYMSMGVVAYVLVAGTVGFTASYLFVHRIFSAPETNGHARRSSRC